MRLNKYGPLDWRRRLPMALVLFGLIFLRYCYYGFDYFFQLDDYIQYHNYTAYNTQLGELIKNLGILSARPLAGLFDLYIWSAFFNKMIWAVAIISAMYAASAMLLHQVFYRRFKTGMLFFVVYALLPMSFEGVYWVSASSRIIVGMFFASLSVFFFDEWCRHGRKYDLLLYAIFQFICFCFYEQVLLFSCALTLVIMLLCLEKRQKRGLYGFLMFVGAGLYFALTALAPSGVYSSRASFFLPWKDGWYSLVGDPALTQIRQAASGGFGELFSKGLVRGFGLLVKEPSVLWLICIILLCAAFFILVRDGNRRTEFRFTWELVCGMILAAAPLSVFLVLDGPWFGMRKLVTSLSGLGLVCDALFDLVFCWFKKGALIQSVVVAVLAFLCCIASVSELHDYREIRQADAAVAKSVAEALPSEAGSSFWILNVDDTYLEDCNFYFHEHGYGVTSSDWALTGAVQYYAGRNDTGHIIPVSEVRGISADIEATAVTPLYFYEDGHCYPAWREGMTETSWRIMTDRGEEAVLQWEDGRASILIR